MTFSRRILISSIAATGASFPFSRRALADEGLTANKAIAKRWMDEVIGAGSISVIDEIVAADFAPVQSTLLPGIDALKQRISDSLSQLELLSSSLEISADEYIAEGNAVAIRFHIAGMFGAEAPLTMFTALKIANGKIIEIWTQDFSVSLTGVRLN